TALAVAGTGAGIVSRVAHTLHGIVDNVRENTTSAACVVVAVLLAVLLITARDRKPEERALCALAAALLWIHLLFGRFGWYYRYEIYALAFGIVVALQLFGADVLASLQQCTAGWTRAGVAAAFVVAFGPYVQVLRSNSRASHDVYERQYQMHR